MSNEERPRHFVRGHPLAIWLLLGLSVAGIGVALCLALSFTMEIDSNSGRIRYQTLLGPIVVTERIEETQFSVYLQTLVVAEKPAKWRHDRVTSVVRSISPHYAYHGVCSALREFFVVCDVRDYSEEEKSEAARHILQLLRDDAPFAMKQYVADISEGRKRVEEPER